MTVPKGEAGGVMLRQSECSRFESGNSVTIVTACFPGRRGGKLAPMQIGGVAILASHECNRFGKVGIGMAAGALHVRMFSMKRIFRKRMVESCPGIPRRPSGRSGMAASAGCLKDAGVRIAVAGRAIFKRNVAVFCRSRNSLRFDVALFAVYLQMITFESVACGPMIEADRLFPFSRIMAAFTLQRQFTAMNILVAVSAFLREPKICAGKILD